MTATWSWDLEAYISGAWTSIKRDVAIYSEQVEASRGISGNSITSRVASPGTLTCLLDNGESNSAGLLGYYSPEHANMRANFGRDTRIRLKFVWNSTPYYKWHGWISDLQPTPGLFKERTSALSAFDYMQKVADENINLISVQVDQRPDQIVQTLLNAMSVAPLGVSIDTDANVLPFALANEQDERTKVMGIMQKLCATVLSYVFVVGNSTNGETFKYQREQYRYTGASLATLDDTMTEFSTSRATSDIKNNLKGIVHPGRMDALPTTLLYELDNEISLEGGETRTFTFRLKDPQNISTRLSALEITGTPVADTHFRASFTQGDAGNDANSALVISVVNGGNSVEWEIENTSGAKVYINLINIFGKGIYYYNPVEITGQSGSADRDQNYDFYYLADVNRANGYLQHLLRRASDDTMNVDGVFFYADIDDTMMGYAMSRDIGDRVTLKESVTGKNGDFVINYVTYIINTDGTLGVRWKVENVRSAVDFFVLDSSLLDGTDVLSPF